MCVTLCHVGAHIPPDDPRRGDRQQLLERYQSRRSGAGAAIAAHNAEGAGAEGTPRFGTPSRATPQVC